MGLSVDKSICRKVQGKAEEGNSCLETPGTCESCPLWGMTERERAKEIAKIGK